MAPATQLPGVELLERGNDAAHFADRAHPKVPAAAVGGASMSDDFSPHEPLMSEHELALAWLREHAGVGRVAIYEVLSSQAGILFVGHQREQHAPRKGLVGQDRGGAHDS